MSDSSKIELDLLPSLKRDFKVLRRIGEGGMGTVFEAIQIKLDRRVAIKILSQKLALDREFIERFQREAKVAAAVNHPGLIQIYDFGEVDGSHYAIQEFVDGENLSQRIKRTGSIPVQEGLRIITAAAEALNAALAKGVIHRDVKPDNIMIGADGRVKVADLGLAKILTDDLNNVTLTGMGLGSPHYMPPEQADDAKTVDHRGDIYSLGITFLTILTGKRPYKGNSPYALIRAHAEQDLPRGAELGTELPEGIDSLIQRMCAKRPEDRYPDYTELLNDLGALQTDIEATIVLPPRNPRTETPSPTNAQTTFGNSSLTAGFSYSENFQTNFATAPSSSDDSSQRNGPVLLYSLIGIAVAALLFLVYDRIRARATEAGAPKSELAETNPLVAIGTIDPAVTEFLFVNAASGALGGEAPGRRPPVFLAGILRPNGFSYSYPLPGGPQPKPKDNPLSGNSFQELLKQADDYANTHPDNLRSILNNYEQLWHATVTPVEQDLARKRIDKNLAILDAVTFTTIAEFRDRTIDAGKRGDFNEEIRIWADYPMELRTFAHDSLVWDAFTNSISTPARQLYNARFPNARPEQVTTLRGPGR
jgi:serine/threonine protein kinase